MLKGLEPSYIPLGWNQFLLPLGTNKRPQSHHLRARSECSQLVRRGEPLRKGGSPDRLREAGNTGLAKRPQFRNCQNNGVRKTKQVIVPNSLFINYLEEEFNFRVTLD